MRQPIRGTVVRGVQLLAASYISKLLFAVATFLIVRHFDVATYGTYAAVFTFASFFAVFLNFGTNDLMVREVAVRPQAGPELLGNNIVLSLVVGAAVYGIMLVSGRTFLPGGTAYALLFAVGAAVVVQSFQQVFWSLLQVHRRVDLAGLGQAFFAVFWLASVLVVVLFNMGLRHLVLLQLATAGLGLAAYLLISAPFLRMRIRPARIPGMLRQVYPFGLSNLFAFVYIQADILLVARISGDYAAGLYAAVFRVLLLVLVVPEMIYKTVLPHLYALTAEDAGRARQMYRHGMVLMLLVMAPFAVTYLLWPEALLTLILGNAYAGAASVLRVFAGVILIQALIHPAGQQLVALGRQHLRFRLQGAVTVLFLAASLAVIPRYGIVGAAWVNAAGRALLLVLYVAALARNGFTVAPGSMMTDIGGMYGMLAILGGALLFVNAPVWIAAPVLAAAAAGYLWLFRLRIPALGILVRR